MKKRLKSRISKQTIRILDHIFCNHPPLTRDEILNEFEYYCSENNIRKSMAKSNFQDAINELRDIYNAPVQRDTVGGTAKKVYYYSDKSFTLKRVELEIQQVQELEKVLRFMSNIKSESIVNMFETIVPILKDTITISPDKNPILYFDENQSYSGKKFILPLYEKILNKRVLRIVYQKNTEELTFHFHPYILKQYNNRWYLYGRNMEAPELLWNISLDRIVSFDEVDDVYKKCHITNWNQYFSDFVGVTRESGAIQQVELLVKAASKQYVISKPIHPDQEVVESGDTVLIRFNVIPNYELESIILSFGENIEVVSPISLKEKIRNRFVQYL